MNAPGSTTLRTSFAVLALLSASLFWGLNSVASKILYRPEGAHADGFGLFVARAAWTLPWLVLLALVYRPARLPNRADWLRIVWLGVCYAGTVALAALGAQYTSAAHVVLLFSLGAPLTGVLAALVLHERLDAPRVAALGLGLAGAALLTLTRSGSGAHPAGDLVMLAWAVAMALTYLVQRDLSLRYPPLFLTGAYGTAGMLLLIAIGLAGGRLSAIAQPVGAAPETLFWFFGVIVFGLSLYGQFAQTYALQILGAGTTSIIGGYAPLLIGLGGSLLLLHETIAPLGILAAVLLAAALGIAVVSTRTVTPK